MLQGFGVSIPPLVSCVLTKLRSQYTCYFPLIATNLVVFDYYDLRLLRSGDMGRRREKFRKMMVVQFHLTGVLEEVMLGPLLFLKPLDLIL